MDASPKLKGQKRLEPSPTAVAGAEFPGARSPPQAFRTSTIQHHVSELTPVASNMGRETCSIDGMDPHSSSRRDIEQLSVPETQSFFNHGMDDEEPDRSSAFRVASHGPHMLGTRRHSHTSRIHPRHDTFQEDDSLNETDLRPVSPSSTSISWTRHGSYNNMNHGGGTVVSESDHYSSRTTSGVHLERDRHVQGSDYVPNRGNRGLYQPNRESRLSSFGIVRDDAQSIFHSNVDSSCRSGQQTSETHDVDDTDFSIPSLRLATQLRSNTYDSYTTISGEDLDSLMEEDSVVVMGSTSYEEPQWGCFPNMSMASVLVSGTIRPPSAVSNRSTARPTSSHELARRSRSSRYMSPEKEREVFDWLHSLEVDKDNNEFVAEAASSKFLTGKINMEDEYISIPEGFPAPNPHVGIGSASLRRETSRVLHPAEIAPAKSNPARPTSEATQMPNTSSNNTTSKRVKSAALGLGSIAEYCGKERRLIVQSQCRRRKKRPVLRSCSGM